MEIFSPYIIAVALAWITAQAFKYIHASIKAKSWKNVNQLYLSGNMPSAHSASVVALATTIGVLDGTNTAVFALAVLFGAVVMYDAMMVRRSSGEQGAALTRLLTDMKSRIAIPRAAKGHSPIEVLVGAALGFAIAAVVLLFF